MIRSGEGRNITDELEQNLRRGSGMPAALSVCNGTHLKFLAFLSSVVKQGKARGGELGCWFAVGHKSATQRMAKSLFKHIEDRF